MWSFHHGRSEWVLRPVLETYEFLNDQFAEIHVGGERIMSTAGHPFWVLRGEDLDARPRPDHITAAEEELLEVRSKVPGRWVDAGDLRDGDVLLLGGGPDGGATREAAIDRVELFAEPQPTYNFAVDDLHNYAVGECGVLVHNGCGKPKAKPSNVTPGAFSITNWNGYPSGVPKPTGPFQLLTGKAYDAARAAANTANAALHRANPKRYAGKHIHEIHPVKFGGSPTDIANKIALKPLEHAKFTTWWNRFMRTLQD